MFCLQSQVNISSNDARPCDVAASQEEKSSVTDFAQPTLSKEEVGQEAESGDGEWVEYVDSLGRSRRCLREDLEEMERRDRDLREWAPPRSDNRNR